MKTALAVIGGLILLFGLMVGCGVVNVASWFASRATVVATRELDPVELQRKYEWFKDAKGQLDAKKADIAVYAQNVEDMKKTPNLDRTDREDLRVTKSELAGMKAAFNNLAGEYNSQMAKWNWRFTNVGGLPPGATEVMPREYTPYVTQ